jgi:hypothetical protein
MTEALRPFFLSPQPHSSTGFADSFQLSEDRYNSRPTYALQDVRRENDLFLDEVSRDNDYFA